MVRPTIDGPVLPLPATASSTGTVSGDDVDWDTGPLTPALALDDLSDVDAPTPNDQDVLTWDDYLQEWIPAASSGGAEALADLTDVDLTGLGDGDLLTWDATAGDWVPTGAPSGTVPDGTDPGDILVWDGDYGWDVLPVGTNGQVLTADSAEALGVKWAAGGGSGGVAVPSIYQMIGSNGLNTTNPAITIKAAADGHRIIVGLNLVGRGANSITCTNTTFTLMNTSTSTGGSRYEIWVGVVSGGASGTTLTVNTSSSNFASIVVIEVGDALTPTAAGTPFDANVTTAGGRGAFGPLSGATAGNFVAMLAGCDNTTASVGLAIGQPGFVWSQPGAGAGTGLAVMYAPASGGITGFLTLTSGTGCYAIIQEIT